MEAAPVENSHSSSPPGNTGHHLENSVPEPQHDREVEPNHEISEEEATSIMEVIAATGRFWHDWEMLRSLLSSRLKQVLAEYPEAQTVEDMIGPQPSSLSGETYPELVKRLDEALLTFVEGPPFTLQRLCEILLNARSIYPNLSKLALALEKNLLVTSTLTMSTEPYPLISAHKPVECEKESDTPEAQANPTENGTEVMSNGDEEMVDAEVEEEKTHKNENEGMETKDEMMAPVNEVIKTSSVLAPVNEVIKTSSVLAPVNDVIKTSSEPVSTPKPADPSTSSEQLNHTNS